MQLSIIIVSWNTRELLLRCLGSIFASPPPRQFEVCVVDNASSDGSALAVRAQFPIVRLIENPENSGFAAANNQALALSRGDYLLLLNSDAAVRPGALAALCRFLDEHPAVGAVGPKLVNADHSFQASYARFPTLWSELALITGLSRFTLGPYAPSPAPRPREQPRPVDWVAGAALMVRRSALEKAGPLDEGYFLYSEETDWCWRLWRAGQPVWYVPSVEVVHEAGASSRQQSARSYTQLYRSKLRFFERNYGRLSAGVLRLAFLVVALLRLGLWRMLLGLAPRRAGQPRLRQRSEQDRALIQLCLSRAG